MAAVLQKKLREEQALETVVVAVPGRIQWMVVAQLLVMERRIGLQEMKVIVQKVTRNNFLEEINITLDVVVFESKISFGCWIFLFVTHKICSPVSLILHWMLLYCC